MKYRFFLLVVLAGFFCSCEKTDGKGETETRIISLPSYNGVSVYLDCSLEIKIISKMVVNDTVNAYDAEVVAQSNIHRLIEYKVEGGILTIRLKENNIIRKYEPIQITVKVPEISYLASFGVARVVVEQLDPLPRTFLDCEIHNASSLNIRTLNFKYLHVNLFEQGYLFADTTGKVGQENLHNQGNGSINLLQVKADTVAASVTGTGDISVSPEKFLNATISGNGNVYYQGDSITVQSNITGKGKVIKL